MGFIFSYLYKLHREENKTFEEYFLLKNKKLTSKYTMYICSYKLSRVNLVLQNQNKTYARDSTLFSTCPMQCLTATCMECTKPSSLDIQVQNMPEVFHHVLRLASSVLLEAGAHLLVEALGKLGDCSPDVAAPARQDPVPDHVAQEVPEHRQGVALNHVGFPGINRCHEYCQARETSFLTP